MVEEIGKIGSLIVNLQKVVNEGFKDQLKNHEDKVTEITDFIYGLDNLNSEQLSKKLKLNTEYIIKNMELMFKYKKEI